ncbi:MAG: alpha/beta fold hydrolase [Chitinophagaceae bacterium]
MLEKNRQHFQYQKTTSVYTIHGSGEPIIFLHGFGLDSSIWKHQITYLSTYFKCISIDLPGFGNSSIAQNELTESDFIAFENISFYAHWLHALLIELHISKCTIIGHSLGGYIAVEFAANYPDSINGIGCIHASFFDDDFTKKIGRQRGLHFIENYGINKYIQYTISSLFTTASLENKYIKRFIASIKKNHVANEIGIAYMKAMMNRKNNTQLLQNIKVPVLFVAGIADTIIPFSEILKQVSLPNCCYFHVLLNTSHMGMLEESNMLNKLLLQYIKR